MTNIKNTKEKLGMEGWKTLTGAGIVVGSAVLFYLGEKELATLVLTIGGAFGLVGMGHKMDKLKKVLGALGERGKK